MWSEIEGWQNRFVAKNAYPAVIPFRGLKLFAPSGIYHPWPLSSSRLIVSYLPRIEGKRVLDLGCGSGAIGLFLADPGMENEVTLADIDPVCVAVSECNAMENERFVRVVRSDLFDGFAKDRSWDVVVFNAPLLCTGPEDGDRMGIDPGGRTTRRFLQQLPQRLEENGVGYLPWVRQVGPDISGICRECNLRAVTLAKDHRESGLEVELLEIRCAAGA